jgi:hypothetical protein
MIDCAHPSKVLRFKINAAAQHMYIYQCGECHLRVGTWLKKSCLDGQRATPFDVEAEVETRRRNWETRSREWRSRYENHLRSDKWRELCRRVRERDRGMCQECLQQPGDHVHHKTYERMGDELLSDLVLLCRDCHEEIHPHMNTDRAAAESALSRWFLR